MFIIKIIKQRPSNNYPIKIDSILSAKAFHIYPESVSYSHDGAEWSSRTIEKGEAVLIINANTGNTLDTYKRT